MSTNVHALILAGGKGSRFWPVSRRAKPKQVLSLGGEQTLLAQTLERVAPLVEGGDVLIMTGREMEEPVRGALPALSPDKFLVEPSPRNTAPCIGWGAAEVGRRWGDSAVVIVLPADHRVRDVEAFRAALDRAVEIAQVSQEIVTLGIQPDRPETGYGYLELGEETRGARRVTRFCEKPDEARARAWLEGGRHLWNAGIFVFRVDVMLEEIARFLPKSASALAQIRQDPGVTAEFWDTLDATSIDYGVMEHSSRILTLPVSVGWSDLGDWEAAGAELPVTPGGRGLADATVAIDAEGCIVHAPGKVVALIGVEDLVVVDTPDAILIMPRSRAQDARHIPRLLDEQGLKRIT